MVLLEVGFQHLLTCWCVCSLFEVIDPSQRFGKTTYGHPTNDNPRLPLSLTRERALRSSG